MGTTKCGLPLRRGEEFVLVRPETDAKTAYRRAQHICELVPELRYSGEAVEADPWPSMLGGLGMGKS